MTFDDWLWRRARSCLPKVSMPRPSTDQGAGHMERRRDTAGQESSFPNSPRQCLDGAHDCVVRKAGETQHQSGAWQGFAVQAADGANGHAVLASGAFDGYVRYSLA